MITAYDYPSAVHASPPASPQCDQEPHVRVLNLLTCKDSGLFPAILVSHLGPPSPSPFCLKHITTGSTSCVWDGLGFFCGQDL